MAVQIAYRRMRNMMVSVSNRLFLARRYAHLAEQATAGIRILRSSRVDFLGNCRVI
jgi:hypothetical protein